MHSSHFRSAWLSQRSTQNHQLQKCFAINQSKPEHFSLSISLSLLLLIMQELLEQIALTTGFLYDAYTIILRHDNFQTLIAIPSIPLRMQCIMFPQPLFTAYHFACGNVHYCFAAVTIIALTACACSNFTNPKHSGSCKTKLQYRKNR